MKAQPLGNRKKSFIPVMIIVPFIIIIMLNLGFSVFAVILVINDAPYSVAILIISQILLWVFAYGGLHWLNKTYFHPNKKTDG